MCSASFWGSCLKHTAVPLSWIQVAMPICGWYIFPGVIFPPYPHALPVAAAAGPNVGAAPSKADALVPAVIKFANGEPVTQQALEDITITTVHASSADDSDVDACDVVVPVIANHCDISKGTELIAHWPIRTATPKRKEPKFTVSTWVHHEAKKEKL